GAGAGAGFGAAGFFAALFFGAAFLAGAFAALLAVFLAAFLADFFGALAAFTDFLAFFADFFEAFFDAFFAARTFFFLAFLPFLAFFPLAIMVLLIAADQCPSGAVSSSLHLPRWLCSITSILAWDRPSPNRVAQWCGRQELTWRTLSASCSRYCPRRSCPA